MKLSINDDEPNKNCLFWCLVGFGLSTVLSILMTLATRKVEGGRPIFIRDLPTNKVLKLSKQCSLDTFINFDGQRRWLGDGYELNIEPEVPFMLIDGAVIKVQAATR